MVTERASSVKIFAAGAPESRSSPAPFAMRLLPAAALLLCACPGGLRGSWFVKGPIRYHVAAPTGADWAPTALSGNDLAWTAPRTGHALSTNATCQDHGDPSLEVLTNHLLIGFKDRELVERQARELDGREALDSHYRAKLDGVAVELRLLVLKKNGCVHDITYVAPAGRFPEQVEAFERLAQAFAQEPAR